MLVSFQGPNDERSFTWMHKRFVRKVVKSSRSRTDKDNRGLSTQQGVLHTRLCASDTAGSTQRTNTIITARFLLKRVEPVLRYSVAL